MQLRWQRRVRRPAHTAGRFLVLLTALAGLFMMHGLADHGVAHHGITMSAAGSTAHASTSAHAAMSAASADVVALVAVVTDGQPSDEDSVAMAGLCLAILVAVIGLTIALVLLSRRLSTLWRPLVLSVEGLLSRARDPVPPDLVRLSIMRC